MRIIDAHVHLSPASALGRGEERLGSRLERNGRRRTEAGGFQAMPPYLTDSCFSAEGASQETASGNLRFLKSRDCPSYPILLVTAMRHLT